MAEHTLQSIAFPVLDEDQIIQLANYATVAPKQFRDGETLIYVGDHLFKFFVVQAGEIEILDYSGDAPKTLTVHRKGQFTGDISHLTGAPAIITAVARGCPRRVPSIRGLRRGSTPCIESVSRPERHHSPGLYRASASTAGIG
jgi:CRP-like cAMP-binding protein